MERAEREIPIIIKGCRVSLLRSENENDPFLFLKDRLSNRSHVMSSPNGCFSITGLVLLIPETQIIGIVHGIFPNNTGFSA